MKTRAAWLGLMVLVVLALAACGGQQSLPEPEEGVLIYAALNPVTKDLQKSVNVFNSSHESVQMEIRDYSDEGGIERLLTELALGRVPDIMEMHYYGKRGPRVAATTGNFYIIPGSYTEAADEYWVPYRQMAQRGYLEDLWPYIESDPDLGREGVLQAPLKAAEFNGGLYILFRKVVIFTLMGRESVVGDRTSWTLDELMEIYSGMPEGSTILRHNMTKRDAFFNLLRFSLDRYTDRETGACFFEGQEFRDLVSFLNNFPDKIDYDEDPIETDEEIIRRIRDGKQMLEGMMITWPREIGFSDAVWQERAAFPGYPTADGSSGSFFYPNGTVLAMSSTCQDKDAAWDFIRRSLLKPILSLSNPLVSFTNIPVNQHDYELLIWGELREAEKFIEQYPEDPTRNFEARKHFTHGPEVRLMHLLTEEDVQRHRDLIDHTTQLYWPDDDLTDIVWDVLGAYFAGDRTLDQTLQMLNNRVGLYLKEAM